MFWRLGTHASINNMKTYQFRACNTLHYPQTQDTTPHHWWIRISHIGRHKQINKTTYNHVPSECDREVTQALNASLTFYENSIFFVILNNFLQCQEGKSKKRCAFNEIRWSWMVSIYAFRRMRSLYFSVDLFPSVVWAKETNQKLFG